MNDLRQLAREVEELARSKGCWSQIHLLVQVFAEALHLRARVMEINQDQARTVQTLTFTYTNYRGEHSQRRVQPRSIRWGTSEWYSAPGWLLTAWDLDKRDIREFSLAHMHDDIRQTDR
mgnify:CR=1 FL=1